MRATHLLCVADTREARVDQGRTVIIVAHRLSAVRDANRIVVMERGQIVEAGAHAELLARPDGRYAALWCLQQA